MLDEDLLQRLGPYRCRVLDITDSMVSSGVLSRGRATPWLLNKEARRRMAWEGLTGTLFSSAWTGTEYQPCDFGSRANEHGVLSLEKPIFTRHRILVETFSGSAGITAACRQSGLHVADPWDISYGPQLDLTKATTQTTWAAGVRTCPPGLVRDALHFLFPGAVAFAIQP